MDANHWSRAHLKRSRLIGLVSALVFSVAAHADNITSEETPRYGGKLDIGTVHYTLAALSWDMSDWVWKTNHDTGLVREQLFAGDLTKSVSRGGRFPFRAEAYIPTDAMRGELAESWDWEDDNTLVIQLRRDVMFPTRPGVMETRELDAKDVVYSYYNIEGSPKKVTGYYDYIALVEARDTHTVVFHFNEYNAEWQYRYGYGFHSAIIPRETAKVDAKDWRNVMGTGPFNLTRYIDSNVQTYARNDDYWDTERLAGADHRLPYLDEIHYRVIKDESTILTALRTGKLDILESIRWLAVDHLKETTPELKWSRWLATSGLFMAMRMDKKPFDDVRVRRAINLAVNQQEIVDLFYGGHAELMAYPQHPGFDAYYQPLSEMPASVQELFAYNPDKAKRLLAEAGYPDGFSFKVQVCTCSPNEMDLVPLLEDYLSKIGVSVEIVPMEYAAFLSVMTTRNHELGYLMQSGHTNPTTSIRKSLITGHPWNPSQFSDPAMDEAIKQMLLERDEGKRVEMVRAMTIEMLDRAPYLWLPTEYIYTAWWPWVKNYGGELRAGAQRPGPIYARIWMDQALKRELGF